MADPLLGSTQGAASSTGFQHSPLAKNEIRLLRIKRGLDSDGRRCNVKTYTLEWSPPYAALSYRWGTTDDRIPIQIGSQICQAMPNAWWKSHYLPQSD